MATAPGEDRHRQDDVLLRLDGVVKHFPLRATPGVRRQEREVVHAVDGVSLELRRGETLGLVGETGCGKSTLARCVVRLHDLTAGRVIFDGQEISSLSHRSLRPFRREMQVIFQDPYGSLNPRRRVGSIIGDPFAIHRTCKGDARKRAVQELMELVGLNPEHYNRFPAEFSGGQRQRIGVARALALRPKLIVCDEPVSALDVSIQAQIINLLVDLQRDFGITYLFIAHDLSVVRHLCDRVAVMYLGQIVETGPVRKLYANPRHPYTAALLSAAPVPDPDASARRERVVLTGDVPSPIDPPPACRFNPRCPKAEPLCRQEFPLLGPGRPDGGEPHLAACHYPLEPGQNLSPPARPLLQLVSRGAPPQAPSPAARTELGTQELLATVVAEPVAGLSVESVTEDGMVDVRADGGIRSAGAPSGPVRAGGPVPAGTVPGGPARHVSQSPVPAPVAGATPRIEGRSPWHLAYVRLRHDRAALIALVVIILIALVAIFAPVFAALTGHGVNEQYPTIGLTPDGLPRPPGPTFPLGTDDLGRDLLVRIAYGTRISLLVGVLATALTVAIGATVGLLAGYFGKFVDTVLARIVDVMLAIPFLLFAISLASVVSVTPLHIGPFTLSQGVPIVVLVIGIFSWATVGRIVRGQVLSIRNREYIEAVRSMGAPAWRVIVIDVLPNVLPTIIVYATLLIPASIVAEAALSYLGIGVPPPTADWGAMIAEAQGYYQQAWWFLTFPSVALLITTLAFNIFGDGVRDAIDPRASTIQKKRS